MYSKSYANPNIRRIHMFRYFCEQMGIMSHFAGVVDALIAVAVIAKVGCRFRVIKQIAKNVFMNYDL